MPDIYDALKLYPELPKKIMQANKDLSDTIKAKLYADGGIKAVNFSNRPSGEISDPTYNKVENLLENLGEIFTELNGYVFYMRNKINELIDMKKDLDHALLCLNREQRKIIELRYFEYPSPQYDWDKVAQKAYYSRSQVFEIHNLAIKRLRRELRNMHKYYN